MQLWQYCLLVTARSLYMFRTLSASIIRGTKTVVAATGACHESGCYISSTDVQGRLPLHYVIAYLGLAVTNKQYCQSCILLVLYVIFTYDARKLKHKIQKYMFY